MCQRFIRGAERRQVLLHKEQQQSFLHIIHKNCSITLAFCVINNSTLNLSTSKSPQINDRDRSLIKIIISLQWNSLYFSL